MKEKTLMIQGTTSHAGKSLVVLGLCRLFSKMGIKVSPFKAQNMSLNAAVTKDGKEISYAQYSQALAANIEPQVEMNPILLKPTDNNKSQLILKGRPYKEVSVKEYYSLKQELIPIIEESLEKLRSKYDLILIEGAGSPAEINLKSHDIVNMWVAKLAGSYVLLVADIERGGVFASILGTLHLLDELERSLIKGIIVNKFRGDVEILTPGYEYIHRTTGVPIIGTIPYIEDLTIEEEDSLALSSKKSRLNNLNKININIIQLPRISNFTDFIPLEKDERVNLTYIRKDLEDPDLIIIPGTKNIISDLNFLKEKGLDKQIREKFHQGSLIIGICEGFQILGKKIMNPNKIENEVTYVEGIGLLDVDTQLCREKITQQTFAETANNGLFFKKGLKLKGYEIHMGRTVSNRERPFLKFKKEEGFVEDGSISPCGKIIGTYLHGLFDNVQFCNNLLNYLWKKKFKKSPSLYQKIKSKEAEYDRLASVLESAIDMKFILDLIKI